MKGEDRRFHYCAYCSLKRLCSFYGRRWLCDYCAQVLMGEPRRKGPHG